MLDVKYEIHYPGEIVKMEGLFKSKRAFKKWKESNPKYVILNVCKAQKRYPKEE